MTPEPPFVGTRRPEPEEDDEVDGVVLYDPTPSPGYAGFDPQSVQEGRSRSIAVVALVLVAAALGVYQLFLRPAPASPDPSAVPNLVPSGLEPTRAALTPVASLDHRAPVGSVIPIEVRARGSAGEPIADSLVQFVVLEGDATLDPDQARTDSSGVARTTVSLPDHVEESLLVARLYGSELETRISLRADPGPPTRLTASAGTGQEAEVTDLLPVRPSVVVTDENGNPVPGVEVLFTVASGEGSVAPARTLTDSLGQTSAMWRLGIETGTQELEATVRSTGSSVTFRANALGRPTQIEGAPRVLERGPVRVTPRTFVVGGSLVCRLVGGSASCRGANDRGQTGGRAASGLVALAAGVSHVCGLDGSGAAVCWGANEGGQLGDGTRTDRPSPVPVRAEMRFSSLTAGAAHTCGIAQGSIAVCWGQNLSGQLGDGTRTDARFPRAVGGGINFRLLAAGWNHTCGLTNSGNAFCWGPNSEGQLGDGSRLDRLVPTLVRGSIDTLAAGSHHTCGISDGRVLCWGDNRFGQVGDGTNESRDQPEAVVGLPSGATQISAGAVHTCALVSDGSAYCWGQNLRGQLGDGTTQSHNTATAVAGGLRFRSIYAGGALTCGLTAGGEEYCWGLNQDGQLGDGTRQNRSTPVRVTG